MKGFKKLLSALLVLAMVVSFSAVTPAEAKAKKLVGLPMQINGECWVDMWAFGDYVKEGFVPKNGAQYSVSYELYIPYVAFNEWNEYGQWDDEDPTNLTGKVCLLPAISWWASDENGEPIDIRLGDFNEWTINHALKAPADDFVFDGLWTEEEGSKFPDDIEGKGVMNAELVDNMVKITVKDLKATSTNITYACAADDWEEKPFEDDFDGTEKMNFGLQFHEWIGGKKVETVYLASASVKMDGKTIWKASMSTKDIAGSPLVDSGKLDEEGNVIFDVVEIPAVQFNTANLTVAKDSVKIKAKKTASVKVATMNPGDKVTVKTSDKKIATVSYKNGKVKIKGKKAGKATITVTANGTIKEIAVTVK